MADPVALSSMTQTGRVNAPDPSLPISILTYNANFASATDLEFDFGQYNTSKVFGTLMSLFVDNGSNPEEVEVYVSGTDQFFTIPANAMGYFNIDANNRSRVRLVTTGGATDKVTVSFYNTAMPPMVWYKFGVFNNDKSVKVEGSNPTGTDMDTADNAYPVYVAGRSSVDGALIPIRVDALGRVDFASSITIGAVTIADGGDVALGSTTDSAITNPATNGTLISFVRGALTFLSSLAGYASPPTTGAITSVTSVITDAVILASNANREGAIIFNNSTSVLHLAFANVDATLSYSYPLAAGETYLLSKGDYTGVIKGTWVAANGAAIVTEFV